jgi:transcriptional regulator with XRE-family HTH domain
MFTYPANIKYALYTNQEVYEHLGQKLKAHRLSKNISQLELAERAGVSRTTVQRLEQSKNIGMLEFLSLVRALGIISSAENWVPEISLPIDFEKQLLLMQAGGRKRSRKVNREKSTLV